MRTRAERRSNKQLLKIAARRLVRQTYGRNTEDLQHKMACNCDNLKMCGGDCCKNPRRSGWSKNHGWTRAEILAEYELKAQ